MRFPESKIKAAIQHPEEEVRLTALRYFTDSLNNDDSVMPLVIKAVEAYGVESAFRILRDADRLPQTESTIDWLIGQLHRTDLDLRKKHDDNYRFAIAIVLCNLSPSEVARRHDEIGQAPLFPQELQNQLAGTVKAAEWSWGDVWSRFIACAGELAVKSAWSIRDHNRVHRLVELLGHYREGEKRILGLLRGEWPDIDPDFAAWIDQDVVRIAGMRSLENAIPFLIERAHLAEENTADHCGQALGRIGTDAVINAIVNDWECGDFNFRLIMCEALKIIHSDLCANACLEFLKAEQDGEVQVELGYAVLSHYRRDAISPVHQLVAGEIDDLFPEQRDLRFRLVAVAAIMGLQFPELEKWHREALEVDWGRFGLESGRIAKNFQS
jgi:hypothetical protein